MFDAWSSATGAVTVYAVFQSGPDGPWMAVFFPTTNEYNRWLDKTEGTDREMGRPMFKVVPLESLRPEWTS